MAKKQEDTALRLEVDLTRFELDDWEILDGSRPGTKMFDIMNVLDRLIVGGVRGKGYSGMQLVDIQKAILTQVQAEISPERNGKN